MADAKWKKIRAEYIRGGTSYRKLAEKYGVSFNSLQKLAKAEKWTDLRKQQYDKSTAKMVEKIASQEADKAVDLMDIALDLAMKIRDGIDDGMYIHDAQSTRAITAALKDLRDMVGRKAEQDLEEQRARIEKLRKEARAEEENRDIRIVIADELKDYSE